MHSVKLESKTNYTVTLDGIIIGHTKTLNRAMIAVLRLKSQWDAGDKQPIVSIVRDLDNLTVYSSGDAK